MSKKSKSDPVVILLDLVIIIMIFVLIAVGYRLYFYKHIVTRSMTFMQDASRLSYDLGRNDYASLIQGTYVNRFNGYNDPKSYHALADYIEALSQYKIYYEKGYDDKARHQQEIMDKSRKEMGDLTIFADKADGMFKIE